MGAHADPHPVVLDSPPTDFSVRLVLADVSYVAVYPCNNT